MKRHFSPFMTPVQMIVFTIVMVLYIPCIATFAALVKEYGAGRAIAITMMNIALALLVGSVAMRVLLFAGL